MPISRRLWIQCDTHSSDRKYDGDYQGNIKKIQTKCPNITIKITHWITENDFNTDDGLFGDHAFYGSRSDTFTEDTFQSFADLLTTQSKLRYIVYSPLTQSYLSPLIQIRQKYKLADKMTIWVTTENIPFLEIGNLLVEIYESENFHLRRF